MRFLKDEVYELLKSDKTIFEFILNASPDGLWYQDIGNPAIGWANSRFWNVLGFDASFDEKSVSPHDFIVAGDFRALVEKLASASEIASVTQDFPVRFRHKDGFVLSFKGQFRVLKRASDSSIFVLAGLSKWAESGERTPVAQFDPYKFLFENNPLPMWVFDSETFRFLEINDAAISLYGYSIDEFREMTILDLRNEAEKKRLIAHISDRSTPLRNSGKWTHRLKSGAEIRVDIKSHQIVYRGRQARLVVVNDVTEQEKIQAELIRSKQVLEQAEAISNTGSWELDLKNNTLYWSDEVFRIAGLEPGAFEVNSASGLSVIHPEDHQKAIAAFQNAIQTATPYKIEKRFVRPDGSIRHINSQGKVIVNDLGEAVRLVGVFQDITEWKRASEELTLTKDLLAETNRIAGIGGWEIHFENKTIYWSEITRQLHEVDDLSVLAQSFEESLELRFAFYKQGESRQRVKTAVQQAREKALPFDIEAELITAKGKERWVRVLGSPVFQNGVCTRIFGAFYDIDSRKRAEIELQRTRDILSQASKIARVGGWEYDVLNGKMYWSPVMRDIHEVDESFEPILDEVSLRAFYKDEASLDRLVAALDGALTHGKSYDIELLLTTAKGRACWVRSIGEPHFEQGVCNRLFGAFADIDAQKRTEISFRESEMELQRSRKHFSTIFHEAPLGVAVIDSLTGEILESNRKYAEIVGLTLPELRAAKWADFTHPDDIQPDLDNMARMNSGETDGFWMEKRYIKPDRTIVWVSMTITRLTDTENGRRRHLCMVEDITSRKSVQEALKRSEKEFRTLADHARDIITRFDRQHRHLYVNRAVTEVTGIPREKWLGKTHSELGMDSPQVKEWISYQKQVFETGVECVYEFTFQSKDGPIHYHCVLLPEKDESGAFNTVLSIARDISAIKKNQEELEKARAEADRANAAKSTFLASMSHEIRTPLNGVIGFSELLQHTALSDIQREYSEAVRKSAVTLLDLTNDILDFSKIEAGMLELVADPTRLRHLAEQTIDVVSYRAGEKGLELLLDIDPEVPDTILADEMRLRQVLLNLLSNATKFTERGEVELRIAQLETSKTKNWTTLRFEVRDTGLGITPEEQDHIFRPFYQQDGSISRRFGGTGLGLAISSRLLEMMDSRIQLESAPGKGSRFFFDVSFAVEESALAKRTEGVSSGTVLLVEDNQRAASALSRLLKQNGFMVEHASNSAQALTLFSTNPQRFAAVLVDFQLRGESGLDFIGTLPLDSVIPVYVLHPAPTDSYFRETHVSSRIRGYLTKPLTERRLETWIAQLSENYTPGFKTPELKLDLVPGNLTVLITDDNELNLQLAGSLLRTIANNAKIVEAQSGQEALQILENQTVDIILMDIQMPGMSGYDATRAIRLMPGNQSVPIIALTAETLLGERERCISAGMNDYLSKPITLAKLTHALKMWLPNPDSGSTTSESTKTEPASPLQHFNRTDLLHRMSGNESMLQEFVKRIKSGALLKMHQQVKQALQHPPSPNEMRALAHTLKGAGATANFEILHHLSISLEHLEPYDQTRALELLAEIDREVALLDRLV